MLYNKLKTELIAYPSASGSITIPSNVTTIGVEAFTGCINLTAITIHAGVTIILIDTNNDYHVAFNGCTGLTSITIDSGNLNYASEGGILYNKAKTELLSYPSASGDVIIPNNVKSLGKQSMAYNGNIISVTLPQGLASIGDLAFDWSMSITSINIPDSVTSIGDMAFQGCTSMNTSIEIPTSVTTVGERAFSEWGVDWSGNHPTIYVRGHANEAAADAAWGSGWRENCYATIVYGE